MRAPGLGWLLVVAALAVGCSTLTPSQDKSLGEVRDFAEETSRRYQLPPIHVLVSHNPDSPVGAYRRGFFAVNELVLASEYRDAIVAHELAHYVLGHDPGSASASSASWTPTPSRSRSWSGSAPCRRIRRCAWSTATC
jgi:hypothetical protein